MFPPLHVETGECACVHASHTVRPAHCTHTGYTSACVASVYSMCLSLTRVPSCDVTIMAFMSGSETRQIIGLWGDWSDFFALHVWPSKSLAGEPLTACQDTSMSLTPVQIPLLGKGDVMVQGMDLMRFKCSAHGIHTELCGIYVKHTSYSHFKTSRVLPLTRR